MSTPAPKIATSARIASCSTPRVVIYRHQVLKQSDVVLARVLLSREFTLAETPACRR